MTIVIAMIAGALLFSAWILYDWAEIITTVRFWLAARVARWLDKWDDAWEEK